MQQTAVSTYCMFGLWNAAWVSVVGQNNSFLFNCLHAVPDQIAFILNVIDLMHSEQYKTVL